MHDIPYAMTINGKRVLSEATASAINPATEEAICRYPLATQAQLDEAVAAAKLAFPAWRDSATAQRQQMVSKLGDLIEAHQQAFIELLITEQGKGRAAAQWEIGGSIHWCREIAGQSLAEAVVEQQGADQIVTRYTPIGVVGAITPWN